MAKLFHTSISNISQSVSLILLTLGISAFVSSPAARIWGKRPVILISNVIAMVGYVIVVARQDSLAALYAGRAIHGFGIAGLEYLVSSTVGDLFFVHERGIHLALWHYALSGGNAIGQVIGSQIVAAQSWVWPFIYYLICTAVYTVIYYFTCPETTYIRSSSLDIDIREELASDSGSGSDSDGPPPSNSEKAPAEIASTALDGESVVVESEKRDPEAAASTEKKLSYWQTLRVFNGRYSDESLLRALITPWTAFLLPAVSWAAYSYGCSVAFSASFSAAMSTIFTKPPYLFTTRQVGLTVLSAFIGATLGNIIPGPLSDWLVSYLSKKNRGVYEPEFRVVLTVPSFFLGLLGFWGFGLSLEARAPWIVPVFFFGLATFAGSIQSLISNSYLLDCHRAQAQDGYAAVTIARGVFSFAMTFVINDWIARDGYRVVYFWIGTLHGISCVMGMVLYVFGKRVCFCSPSFGPASGLLTLFLSRRSDCPSPRASSSRASWARRPECVAFR